MTRPNPEGQSNIWAVVPVKRLGLAKQRLAPVLSRSERAELARTMLHDVLTTLCATPQLAGIIVVSGDPAVAKLAMLFDARVVGDVMESGVNAAVLQGLRTPDPSSAGVLVIPADVPFATAADLQAVIAQLGHFPIVLAPALSDGGTNTLAMRRPDLIAPSFGDDSFARHQALARDAGLGCGIVRSEGLGRDIDYPSDLVPCTESKKFSLTAALLAEFKLADRPGVTAFPVSKRHM
jgi:2-phospho-L-lactate/phosphoenolpyruvate guanylyltransferase